MPPLHDKEVTGEDRAMILLGIFALAVFFWLGILAVIIIYYVGRGILEGIVDAWHYWSVRRKYKL